MSEKVKSQRNDRFPSTRVSAIVAASSADPNERARGFEVLVEAYWMPLYKYIRIKWSKPAEDARDLTQGFFTEAIEKNFFARYDPERARFRTFIRACVDGFIANQDKAAHRIKRGGGVMTVAIDFEEAEAQLHGRSFVAPNDIEDFFEKEWTRSVFGLALDSLRHRLTEAGKTTYYEIFQSIVLAEDEGSGRPSYRELAEQFSISVSDVTNYLALARREFRSCVLAKLRELTASEEEYQREARALLGVTL